MIGAVCGTTALVDKVMGTFLRSGGLNAAPYNAWTAMKGLETLALRVKAQSASALTLATGCKTTPKWPASITPAFSHPQHALAMRQQNGMGGPLAFDVVGQGVEQLRRNAFHVIDSTQVPLHHRQPGRCENHYHPPGQHFARPPDRRPAPGRWRGSGLDSYSWALSTLMT